MFKRISLFLLTNILVMATIGIAWTLISTFFNVGAYGNVVQLLLFCGVFGMFGAFISLLMSKFMAKTMMGVKIISADVADPTLRNLINRVHALAQKAGLSKMPEVGVFESDDVNAFATGPSRSNSLVAVSSGLLRRMESREVDGVLGHEIAHIANGDMVTMTLITGVVNTFSMFFSRILANLISNNVDDKYRHIVYFVCVILGDIMFTVLGSIVVNSFSRRREYRADAGGAQFSSRENMVAALQRLKMLTTPASQSSDRDAFATLKISSGAPHGGLAALLMTHPALDDRIAALQSRKI